MLSGRDCPALHLKRMVAMPAWVIGLLKGFLKHLALPALGKLAEYLMNRKNTQEYGKPAGELEERLEDKVKQDGFKV